MTRIRRANNEVGDAGVAFVLIIPALLFVVVHLITASQQLYERREAWAVAAAASRVGAQADPLLVRQTNAPTIDTAKARAAVARYVNDAGYQLDVFDLQGNTLTIQVSGTIDYVFPTILNPTITGEAETTLRAGVVTEGG